MSGLEAMERVIARGIQEKGGDMKGWDQYLHFPQTSGKVRQVLTDDTSTSAEPPRSGTLHDPDFL